MKYLQGLLLLCVVFFAACKGGGDGQKGLPLGHWYKRYTGTVAGMPVVVNMACRKRNDSDIAFSCNYYYTGKSQLISLSPDSVSGTWVRLSEYVPTERDQDGSRKYPVWEVTIDEAGIKDQWHSADGKKTHDILLTENYDGAYRFGFIDVLDSASVKGRKDVYWMGTEHSLIVPSAEMDKGDAAFITQALLQELGGEAHKATSFDALVRMQNKTQFDHYKETLGDLANDTDDALEGEFNNWSSSTASNCAYNDNGLVVFDIMGYDYTGGVHGMYGTSYVCVDVREKKLWHLQDILNVDTAALIAMLETEARKSFSLKPNDTLSHTLLVDTIPVTDNILISGRGITFHYNPYEVACYADGYVDFFLPYTRLSGMLTPAFRKRMGL